MEEVKDDCSQLPHPQLSAFGSPQGRMQHISLGITTVFTHVADHLRRVFRSSETPELARLDWKDRINVALCTLTYTTFIFCRNFMSPLAPSIKDDGWGYDNVKHSNLLLVAGAAYGVGKLVNGAIVDQCNPRICLLVFILGSSSATILFSFLKELTSDSAARYDLLLVILAVNALFQSGAHCSFTKYAYERFRPEQYAYVFSFLSIGSRAGAVFTSLLLGALQAVMEWPNVCRVAVGITAFGGICISCTYLPVAGRSLQLVKAEKPVKSTVSTQLRKYVSWWTDARFVLMTVSTGLFGMLSVFDGFISLWVKDVFAPSNAISGMMAAMLPLGIVVSIALGGYSIPGMAPLKEAKVICSLIVALVIVIGGLLALTALNEGEHCSQCVSFAAFMTFAYGLFLGYPYYIPPAVFSLDFGKEDAGMVASFMDVVSAVLGAGVSAVGGRLSEEGWEYVWCVILGVALLGLALLCLFHVKNLAWLTTRRLTSTEAIALGEATGDEFKVASISDVLTQPIASPK